MEIVDTPIDTLIEKFDKEKFGMNLYHHTDQINAQKQDYMLLSKMTDVSKYPLFKLLCWTIPFKNSIPHMFKLMRYAEYSKICILEIGTCHGASAVVLGIGSKYSNNDPKLITVDITQPENEAKGYFNLFKEFLPSERRIVESDSKLFSFNEPVDLLYIDGSHEFDDVYKDCSKYIPLVTEGGICIFHDTGDSDVSRSIIKFFNDNKDRIKFKKLRGYPINSISSFLYNNVGISAVKILENSL